MPDGRSGYGKGSEAVRYRARHQSRRWAGCDRREHLHACQAEVRPEPRRRHTMSSTRVNSPPICRQRLPSTPRVHLDHVTRAVRVVLCFNCNGGLWHFRDCADVLRRAAAYLEGDVWTPIPVAAGVYRLPS